MKNILLLRLITTVICLSALYADLVAQAPSTNRTTIMVTVDGLTSEVRDGLVKDLERDADLKMIYACVPAGIMVFEDRSMASREQLRGKITPRLEHRIARNKISIDNSDRGTAEERCAQARNR